MCEPVHPRSRSSLSRVLLALAVAATSVWVREPGAGIVAGLVLVLIAMDEPGPVPSP